MINSLRVKQFLTPLMKKLNLIGISRRGSQPVESNQPVRFEQFTGRARKVLKLSQEEAQHLKHNFIGTEHLLLGLIREGEGVAGTVLKQMGLTIDAASVELLKIMPEGNDTPARELCLTARSKKILELAVDEARKLEHNYIGTEHLLLGLIREGNGVAIRILTALKVSPEEVRQRVLKLLQ